MAFLPLCILQIINTKKLECIMNLDEELIIISLYKKCSEIFKYRGTNIELEVFTYSLEHCKES